MHTSAETRKLGNLEFEIQTQTLKVKDEVKNLYPPVTFETERARRRPDEETLGLYHRLVSIGHMKPRDKQSEEDLKAAKKKWEEDAKEKAKRTGRVSFSGMNLSSLDLSELDLSGIDFSMAKFEGSNLSGANFRNSAFMLASLKGANLDDAVLAGALFISADLSDTSLRRTNMQGNFVYSDFTGAVAQEPTIDPQGFFRTVNFPLPVEYPKTDDEGWFKEALSNAPLKSSEDVVRENSILQKVDKLLEQYRTYLRSNPEETDPIAKTLKEELIEIGKTRPTSEDEKRALADRKVEWIFKKKDFGKILVLDGMDLSNLDLSTMDLTNTSLIGANCEGADFTWSVLSGINCSLTNFRGAKLRMDSLRGCIPFGADFSGADMSAARLRNTAFIRAKFIGAKLEYTDFKGSVLLGADFTDATIEGVDFDGSTNLENLRTARFI